MIYLLKEKFSFTESHDDPNAFSEYTKAISLKNLPKSYRSKEALTYLVEKINDK